MDLLQLAGRQAKWVLALGLVVAAASPTLAQLLSGWLVPLIMTIMFVGALRLRPDRIQDLLDRPWTSLRIVLVFQLGLPLAAAAIFAATGQLGSLVAAAVIIALSAPGIVSSPNIAAIMGLDGAAAMRLVGIGTVLVPFTCLPPLLLLYGPVDAAGVLWAAGKLALILTLSAGSGILVRRLALHSIEEVGERRLDGLSAISLSVFVIALMPAFRETLLMAPLALLGWLVLAVGLNFGLQWTAFTRLSRHLPAPAAGSAGLIAGNRNMALFFAALPAAHTEPLLPYLAAYQIPMYLTPLLMGWLYASASKGDS